MKHPFPPRVADHSRHGWRTNPLTEPFENEPSELIDNSPPSPSQEGAARQEDHSASFEEFWKVYPRHVAKGTARRSFEKALKTASAGTIIAGARRYAAERAGQEPKFTKHPTTWLNAECWTDEPSATGAGSIIDPLGNILGQSEKPSRSMQRTPGQQREDHINDLVSAALRRTPT